MKKQITIHVYIYAQVPDSWRYGTPSVIDGVHYRFSVLEEDDKTLIAKVNLTFDAPSPEDVTAGFVAELNQQKKKLMAEHQNAITNIDRKIQELLAIACEVAE